MLQKITAVFSGKKTLALLASTLLIIPVVGQCGSTSGTISLVEIVVGPTGPLNLDLAFVYSTGTNSARPACNTYSRYVLDLSRSSGKAAYAAILAAKTTGATVTLYGNGACDIYSNSETLVDIQQ